MSRRIQQIQQLLRQFRQVLQCLMTQQQKKYFQKLVNIYKDLVKNQNELGIQNNDHFYSSIMIQFYSLKKDVLNNKKFQMSDYQAFLFKNQLYKQHKNVFLYIPQNSLMERITLPKRSICYEQKPNIQLMKQFNFCPLGHSINTIIGFSLQILYKNVYCGKNFKQETMNKLLCHIARQYQVVSYHNFTHAFSVQLMLFQCYQRSQKLKTIFTPFQIFVSYVAALAHDIGHCTFAHKIDETNNDFEVKKKSDLAKLYSNQSVLENMHVAKFCKILRKNPQIDIISQIKDPVERQRTKRLIIRLILGTDVSKHFENLSGLKSLQSKEFSSLSMLERQIIHENLFHGCDIGNCCLEFGDFMNWAFLLSYEFNSQYQMELDLGLQPTAIFRYNGEKGFYKGQCGFVDVLALPLWKNIGDIFDELKILVCNIQINRKQLQKLVLSTEDQQSK